MNSDGYCDAILIQSQKRNFNTRKGFASMSIDDKLNETLKTIQLCLLAAQKHLLESALGLFSKSRRC